MIVGFRVLMFILLHLVNHELTARRNDDSNFNSSFSDLSIGNDIKPPPRIGRSKLRDRVVKHDQLLCLYCSRLKPVIEVRKASDLREAFFAGEKLCYYNFFERVKSILYI